MVPVLFLLVRKGHPESRVLFPVFYLPACIWLAVAAVVTIDGFTIRCISLMGCLFLFLLFSGWLLEDVLPGTLSSALGKAVLCAFICTLSVGMLWGYVYRDSQPTTTRCRVSDGIYRGLYTSAERAQGLMELERTLRAQVDPEGSVLFLDTVPFAYLMTDARPCAPSSWDFSGYVWGRNDDTWYQNYFRVTQQIPDQIVYLNTGTYTDHVSIEDPTYHFNDFVQTHYQLMYQDTRLLYPIRIYARADNSDPYQVP